MKLHLIFSVAGFLIANQSLAQEATLGDLLNLETKVTVAKMKEELAKSSATEVKLPVLPKLDVPVKRAPVEPKTIAIYGVSPNYEGLMDFDGRVMKVKQGSSVFGKSVVNITAEGITLLTPPKAKVTKPVKKNKSKRAVKKPVSSEPTTQFYPVLIS